MAILFDWEKATIKLSVPVHHTAVTEVQEIEVPLTALKQLLVGTDSLPLAILSPSDLQRVNTARQSARDND